MTQGDALSVLKTGANAFLTGEPGSGKTHTINAYIAWLRASGIEPSVTAATGIAATHVSGMTLHSWSGIGILEHVTESQVEEIAEKEHIARRIQKAKVLIIDEVSMLSATTFEAVDAVCKEVRRNGRAFGGLQVILVGDFFQLPPIAKAGRDVRFAYDSEAWKDLNPIVCYLAEQHRQEDGDYLEVLSAIRHNEVETLHYERLVSRTSKTHPEDVPKLYSHNMDVDRINAEELAKLEGKYMKFLMVSQGGTSLVEGLKRGCLSPEVLELKKGAAVMFTKNAPQGRFVNGTLGTVIDFETSGTPVIETRSGDYIVAERMDWQVEENGRVRGSISQVPLRLAYAMTIHKSQGMSMDAAIIDLSKVFEYGQGYVALSRVRTLGGLHLLGINERALQVHPLILEKDRELRLASEAARETFTGMKKEELEALQRQFVKAMGGAWGVAAKEKRPSLAPRLAETLQVVRDATSLKEAAKERGLTPSTIVSHLEELHEAGNLTKSDFIHLLPDPDALTEIQEAWEAVGGDRLSPVYKALRGTQSYESIRLAKLAQ